MVRKVESQLYRATGCIHKPPLAKLFNPGVLKFAVRFFERARRKGRRKHAKLFFGEKMEVVLPEVISETIYTYGFFDEIVSNLIVRNVKEGDIVLDVGAHFGYFSLLFSHLVGSAGKVYAFEPTPSTFEVLNKNTQEKGNIISLNLALGMEDGTREIRDYGLKYCAWNTMSSETRMPEILDNVEYTSVQVNVVNPDRYLAERLINPNFIKIDAENFEFHVVSGLRGTIKKNGPKVLMETGTKNTLQAAELLLSCGYIPFIPNEPGLMTAWTGPIEEANRMHKDILFLPSR